MVKTESIPLIRKLFIPEGGLGIYLKLSPTMKVYGRELDTVHPREVVNIVVRSTGTNEEFLER